MKDPSPEDWMENKRFRTGPFSTMRHTHTHTQTKPEEILGTSLSQEGPL